MDTDAIITEGYRHAEEFLAHLGFPADATDVTDIMITRHQDQGQRTRFTVAIEALSAPGASRVGGEL